MVYSEVICWAAATADTLRVAGQDITGGSSPPTSPSGNVEKEKREEEEDEVPAGNR